MHHHPAGLCAVSVSRLIDRHHKHTECNLFLLSHQRCTSSMHVVKTAFTIIEYMLGMQNYSILSMLLHLLYQWQFRFLLNNVADEEKESICE